MGGSDKILARGRELDDEGKYLLASEIINKLVQAEPDNEAAKDMLATFSSRSATSRRTPAYETASSRPLMSSDRGFRRERPPTQAAPT